MTRTRTTTAAAAALLLALGGYVVGGYTTAHHYTDQLVAWPATSATGTTPGAAADALVAWWNTDPARPHLHGPTTALTTHMVDRPDLYQFQAATDTGPVEINVAPAPGGGFVADHAFLTDLGHTSTTGISLP